MTATDRGAGGLKTSAPADWVQRGTVRAELEAEEAVLLEPAPQLALAREPEPVVAALRLRVRPPALEGVEVGAADGPEAQGHVGYLEAAVASPRAAWPAARRAVGTRNGEQDT